MKKKILSSILIIIAIIAVWSIVSPVELSNVLGNSMAPTLPSHSYALFANAHFYSKPLARGTIVIYDSSKASGITYVDRVIGLPGETIHFQDGAVIINGNRIDEPYLTSGTSTAYPQNSSIKYPYKIPENTYFMLGDKRDRSNDSRYFGAIPVSNIRQVYITCFTCSK